MTATTRPFEIGLFTFGEITAGRGADTESFPLFGYVEETSQGARDTFHPTGRADRRLKVYSMAGQRSSRPR